MVFKITLSRSLNTDLGSDSANHSSEDDDNNEEKCDDFEGSGLPNMATLGLYVVGALQFIIKHYQFNGNY